MGEPWQDTQRARGQARQCPLRCLHVQRTAEGTLADGMHAHYRVVHPGQAVPRVK